jgi:mannose/fructose/N-acetylgalactosamine-specific phosphotransferase system component IID
MFENTEFIICVYRKDYENYDGDSYLNITGDIIFTIIGYLLASKTIYGSVLFLIISEIILIPYKANFLELSFGSLLKKTNLSSCY